MSGWFSLSLGDGMTASIPAAEIEAAFAPAHLAAGSPAEMAVFTRLESEGRLHCEVIAYFSPAAKHLALAHDAEPCKAPEPEGLTLLAGQEEAWRALFPVNG